ncbi:MAG: hypothetical protein Q8K72_03225 [Acidimicrobiales bacterium]|nr:hypothetical protein [Acidimicrobiales bacterium]
MAYTSNARSIRVAAAAATSAPRKGLWRRLPGVPRPRCLDWHLTDPAGKTPTEIRPIRDDIDARVRALLAEIVLT